MGYWSIIPRAVRKSKILTGDEKELYYEIADNMNEAGYCTLTNSQLAKALGTSEKTVSTRLSSLVQKKFANTLVNLHKHQRRIYLKVPGDPTLSNQPKPTDEDTRAKRERLEESLKKAIVLGTCDFNVLLKALKQSPYLEEVKDNYIQVALDLEQIEFVTEFRKFFKEKEIDCQVSIYPGINYRALMHHLMKSEFIRLNNNLSLSWCLKNYKDIVHGKYDSFVNKVVEINLAQDQNYEPYISRNYKPFFQDEFDREYEENNKLEKYERKKREYSREELNALFQSLEGIEI